MIIMNREMLKNADWDALAEEYAGDVLPISVAHNGPIRDLGLVPRLLSFIPVYRSALFHSGACSCLETQTDFQGD